MKSLTYHLLNRDLMKIDHFLQGANIFKKADGGFRSGIFFTAEELGKKLDLMRMNFEP